MSRKRDSEPSPADPADIPEGHGRHRRVTTEPPPGSDPTPSPEPPRHRSDDNDERLKAEKPPHY